MEKQKVISDVSTLLKDTEINVYDFIFQNVDIFDKDLIMKSEIEDRIRDLIIHEYKIHPEKFGYGSLYRLHTEDPYEFRRELKELVRTLAEKVIKERDLHFDDYVVKLDSEGRREFYDGKICSVLGGWDQF